MTPRRLAQAFLFLLVATVAARANTVEYVSLEVTSDSTRDRYSSEHQVHNSRIQGYRMPFVGGEDHRVTIIGHLTDFLDRVQIKKGGSVTRTIQKEDLVYVGHTDEHGGKGKIVFDLRRQDLPPRGETFQIRIRFANEIAGFDKLDCKVVWRGKIQSAEWSTAGGAELPEFETADSGTPYDRLTRDRTYKLNLICFKCPSSIQLGDGINEEFFDQEVRGSSLSVESIPGVRKKIGATFRLRNQFGPGDVRDLVEFADAGVGNIEGGWGGYIYSRIEEENLPGRSTANPLRTDLQHVRARGFGSSGSSGLGGTTPPTWEDSPDPNAQPDIVVTIENAFTSGSTFSTTDSGGYDFCLNLPDEQQVRTTGIRPLTLKVKNVGDADITTPFRVSIVGGGNPNFYDDHVETINSLQAGETYTLIVSRRQSIVCARRSGSGCARCPENLGGNGVTHWNDRGLTVSVDHTNVIAESIETNNTASVP